MKTKSEQIKEILNGVMSKVSGDNADEVKTDLRQLVGLVDDMASSLKSFGEENKAKRLEITKLEEKIRNIEAERDKFRQDYESLQNSDDLKELDQLRNEKKTWQERLRKEFQDSFLKVVKHPNFEKAKNLFPDLKANEKGEYDFSALDDQKVEQYSAELKKLQDLEFFGTIQKKTVHGDNPQPDQNKQKPVNSEEDLRQRISVGLSEYLNKP